MGSERDWKWNTGVSPSPSPPSSPPASPPASPTASPASSGTSGKTSPSSRARPLTGLMFSAAIAGAGLSRHSGLAAILAAGVTVITMSTPALAAGKHLHSQRKPQHTSRATTPGPWNKRTGASPLAGYISSATVEGAVDCEVAWGSQYTPCSKEGLQVCPSRLASPCALPCYSVACWWPVRKNSDSLSAVTALLCDHVPNFDRLPVPDRCRHSHVCSNSPRRWQ